MTYKKETNTFDRNLKKAGTVIGQFLAKSQARIEKTGKRAMETTERLVESISHKNEQASEQAMGNISINYNREERAENMSSPRFRPIKNKPIDESLRLLGEDIIEYLTDNGKTTTAEMMMVMERRRRNQAMIFGAIGWLAAENRIHITRNGQHLSLR